MIATKPIQSKPLINKEALVKPKEDITQGEGKRKTITLPTKETLPAKNKELDNQDPL
jgi:hypothetical protein